MRTQTATMAEVDQMKLQTTMAEVDQMKPQTTMAEVDQMKPQTTMIGIQVQDPPTEILYEQVHHTITIENGHSHQVVLVVHLHCHNHRLEQFMPMQERILITISRVQEMRVQILLKRIFHQILIHLTVHLTVHLLLIIHLLITHKVKQTQDKGHQPLDRGHHLLIETHKVKLLIETHKVKLLIRDQEIPRPPTEGLHSEGIHKLLDKDQVTLISIEILDKEHQSEQVPEDLPMQEHLVVVVVMSVVVVEEVLLYQVVVSTDLIPLLHKDILVTHLEELIPVDRTLYQVVARHILQDVV